MTIETNQGAALEARASDAAIERTDPDTPMNDGRLKLRLWWVIVVFAYAALLYGFTWPQQYRNPSLPFTYSNMAAFFIRTFIFHIGVGMAAVVVIALFLRSWRLCVATIPPTLMGLGPAVFSYLPRTIVDTRGETVTVMTLNLNAGCVRPDKVVGEIRSVDPDVLVVQEYTPKWREKLSAALGTSHPHSAGQPRTDCFGTAIYSKLPFEGEVDTNLVLGDWPLPQSRAEILIDGEPVAIYNIHLVPPFFRNYPEMRRQYADLIRHVQHERIPMIIAGDLNFTETSGFAVDLHRRQFMDAFSMAGTGRGSTWPDRRLLRYLPGFRIDHIYLSNALTCAAAHVGSGAGSDHRPVVAEIGFKRR